MSGFNVTASLVGSDGSPVLFNITGRSNRFCLTIPMEIEDLKQFPDGKATLVVYEPEDMDDREIILTKVISCDHGIFGCWEYR